MVTIFITGKVVDTIHIRHLKVTVYIVTQKKELLLQKNEKSCTAALPLFKRKGHIRSSRSIC